MTGLTNRWDFVLFLDVENGNPNGDPDAGNMPRMDPETGHGLMSDVSIKRKVRDYVEQVDRPGSRIFVTASKPLNKTIAEAYEINDLPSFEKKGGGWDRKDANNRPREQVDIAQEWLCSQFYDIRAFGAVLSTGPNAGQVKGPVQFTFARSVEPILPSEQTITRVVDVDKIEPEFGKKHIVHYGLYRMHGFVSAPFGRKTGFNNDDLDLLWIALRDMLDVTRTASKGMMAARRLIAFRHESDLGNAQAHRLFERVSVSRMVDGDAVPPGDRRLHNVPPARAFSDYRIDVDDADLPEGVTLHEPW
ncbi:MAG: type I-C CRISPR-associated protein Cas7/Csd2 [Litorimonas sp.]